MRRRRFICIRLSNPYMTCSSGTPFNRGRSPPQLLTEAAPGCLKPPPTGWLRRAHLHLSYSMTLARLLDTTCLTTVLTVPYTAVRVGCARIIYQRRKAERFEVGFESPTETALARARYQGPRPLPAVLLARRGRTPSASRAARPTTGCPPLPPQTRPAGGIVPTLLLRYGAALLPNVVRACRLVR